MPSYQELEYNDWPLVQKDPTLESLIAGIISAGRMLHEAYYRSFNGALFVKQPNAVANIANSEAIMAKAISEANPQDLIIGKTINPDADYSRGLVWLLNGIDGFDNFANGRDFFDVMVTQVEDGVQIRSAVYDIIHGQLFYAVRGNGSYVNGQQLVIPDAEMTKDVVIAYAPLVTEYAGGIPEDERLVEAVWRGRERLTREYSQYPREMQAGGIELSWVAAGRLGGFVSSLTTPKNLHGVLIVTEAGGIATNMDGGEWKPGTRGVVTAPPKIHAAMLKEFQRYLPRKI